MIPSCKRQPPCEAVSWNVSVSVIADLSFSSASLWGCELKCKYLDDNDAESGQPPCEAVSWNVIKCWFAHSSLSQPPCEAVSWNTITILYLWCDTRQPPCEAVSWNMKGLATGIEKSQSASLWGCELKYKFSRIKPWLAFGQPPCEAVSWNS